jgi:hypothetical protein
MATKRLPHPRDPISLAKLIGDIATGQVVDAVDTKADAAAVELGRKGGEAKAWARCCCAPSSPKRRVVDFACVSLTALAG